MHVTIKHRVCFLVHSELCLRRKGYRSSEGALEVCVSVGCSSGRGKETDSRSLVTLPLKAHISRFLFSSSSAAAFPQFPLISP